MTYQQKKQRFYEDVNHVKSVESRVNTQVELSLLAKLFQGRKELLDLGCWYGRLAIPLAKQGFTVTGIDFSANMLKAATIAKAEQNLNAVELVLGDITALPWETDVFDGAYLLFSTYAEIQPEARVKTLQGIRHALKQESILIIDIVDVDELTDEQLNDLSNNGAEKRGKIIIVWEKADTGEVDEIHLPTTEAVNENLQSAGFHLLQIFRYSSLDGGRKRVLIVAKK